jgi:hypothetical protein
VFPELGLDLVEEEEGEGEGLSGHSWQDNWLFRRGGPGREGMMATGQEPVTMLVPNPVQGAKAQIGDTDFDLVGRVYLAVY